MEHASKRVAVLCVAVGLFLAVVYQSTRLWLAWSWECSSSLRQQIRGARLTPGDAEAWDRIGEAIASNFDAQPGAAISFFQHAVAMDPRSANDWMDLAQAYEADGNISEASAAYQRAQQDYPISAEVAWSYGNFLLRQGQIPGGVEEVHRALVTDYKLVPLALSRIWNSHPDVHVILNDVLPPGQYARLQALDFFAGIHEQAAALETWKEVVSAAKTQPLALPDAFPFLQYLITTDQAAEAESVWREAIAVTHWESQSAGASRIWNGGFEKPIANGGLDWRISQVPGAYTDTDANVRHSCEKSLRVDFTGGVNLDFRYVEQIVPVQPSTNYIFQYFMRTQSISTESGLRFEVLDLNDNQVNLMTPDLTGTNPWTAVKLDFATGQKTHFLDIR
ncbi:MAG TPA: tetratricopeptide repeat protein, partial [Candidatus Acidoferrales bacterium]|nr:tetratricopeptide repeat protein [Candidatus Acidoferrales bacterium]